MEKQKVKDEIAARFGKKNWLVKALPIVYCVTGVLLMTAGRKGIFWNGWKWKRYRKIYEHGKHRPHKWLYRTGGAYPYESLWWK